MRGLFPFSALSPSREMTFNRSLVIQSPLVMARVKRDSVLPPVRLHTAKIGMAQIPSESTRYELLGVIEAEASPPRELRPALQVGQVVNYRVDANHGQLIEILLTNTDKKHKVFDIVQKYKSCRFTLYFSYCVK